jgi:hypothetical protein
MLSEMAGLSFSLAGFEKFLTISGSIIAFMLGITKLWELFWKDRVSLASTYCLNGHPDVPDEITIVNLGPVPVHVSHWRLEWQRRYWPIFRGSMDATPEETGRFKIDGYSAKTLVFDMMDKLPWGKDLSGPSKLILTLHVFGRKRPKRMPIAYGP